MNRLRAILVAGIDPAKTRPGGIRSYVLGLARYLVSAGVEVTLFGIGGPADAEPFQFVSVSQRSNPSSIAFQRDLRKTVRKRDIAANIVHFQRPDDVVALLPGSKEIPFVVTVHGDPLPGIRGRHGRLVSVAYRKLERRGVEAAKRVLFIDSAGRVALAERYPEATLKFADSRVGIDLAAFAPKNPSEARALWELDSGPTILFAGRFEHEKNLDLLVRALAHCETHPTLLLAGAAMDGRITVRGIQQVTHRFLGIVPHDRMSSLYSAVDATVLTSIREAMPLVCLESLACGTPVVATRVGAVKEVIESGRNGFVTKSNPTDFAHAIDRVVREGSSMRSACRASVMAFGWDRVGPSVLREYEKAMV